jgi:hypothetical protein
MVTADRQIHKKPPIALGLKILLSRLGKNRNQKLTRFFDCREITMRPNVGNCNAFFATAVQQIDTNLTHIANRTKSPHPVR